MKSLAFPMLDRAHTGVFRAWKTSNSISLSKPESEKEKKFTLGRDIVIGVRVC
jgi:hypothetical protein